LYRKIVLIDTKLILEYPTNREENLKDFENKKLLLDTNTRKKEFCGMLVKLYLG
jgi:hypothetical protein